MDDFAAVPKELYSWIGNQNAYKTGMMYQIKYFWQRISDLYQKVRINKLIRIISRSDCWIRVENLHGFVLDGYKVGKLLIEEDTTNPHKAFIIACRCCLEKHIHLLSTRAYGPDGIPWSTLNDFTLERNIRFDRMIEFWLDHRVEILNIDNLPVFKLGLNAAIETNQLFALKYFWDKINTLSANRIPDDVKDGMIMEYACKALKLRETPPEIFEFFFSQMNPNQYAELLKMDLKINCCCKTVPALLKTLHFEDAGMMFYLLEPSDVTADSYHDWLNLFEFRHLSGRYLDAATSVYERMCSNTWFGSQRSNFIVLTNSKKRKLCELY